MVDDDGARDRPRIDLSGDRGPDPAESADGRDPADSADEPAPDEDGEDDPHRPEPRSTPIEPGSPNWENAAFVLLGALLTVLVLFRLFAVVLG